MLRVKALYRAVRVNLPDVIRELSRRVDELHRDQFHN
jgi:hypothetical protein